MLSSPMVRNHPIAWFGVLLVFVLVFLLCFFPLITANFGVSDDYVYLDGVLRHRTYFDISTIHQGRLVLGLVFPFAFSQVVDIADLAKLRLVGIITVACLSFCFYRAMVAAGWSKLTAFCVSLTAFTMPPFQVYASWATTAFFPVAGIAAGASLLLADNSYGSKSLLMKGLWAGASAALLVLALCTYQPTAMFFWAFAAVRIFRPDLIERTRDTVKRFGWYLTIFASSCAVGYTIFAVGTAILGREPGRGSLATDPISKISWFFEQPLTDALNLANLHASGQIAVATALIILVGLLLYFQGTFAQRLLRLTLAMTFLPLSYLPNLVIAESWSTYRTKSALTVLIALYVFSALWGYLGALSRSARKPVICAIAGVSACCCLFLASTNVRTYFVIPHELELKLLKEHLVSDTDRSKVIRQLKLDPVQDSLAQGIRYDEFGILSCAQLQSKKPLMGILLREIEESRDKDLANAVGPPI